MNKNYQYEISAYNYGNATSPVDDFVTLKIEAPNEKTALQQAKEIITRDVYRVHDVKEAFL